MILQTLIYCIIIIIIFIWNLYSYNKGYKIIKEYNRLADDMIHICKSLSKENRLLRNYIRQQHGETILYSLLIKSYEKDNTQKI